MVVHKPVGDITVATTTSFIVCGRNVQKHYQHVAEFIYKNTVPSVEKVVSNRVFSASSYSSPVVSHLLLHIHGPGAGTWSHLHIMTLSSYTSFCLLFLLLIAHLGSKIAVK